MSKYHMIQEGYYGIAKISKEDFKRVWDKFHEEPLNPLQDHFYLCANPGEEDCLVSIGTDYSEEECCCDWFKIINRDFKYD